jgi:hypothetical protein
MLVLVLWVSARGPALSPVDAKCSNSGGTQCPDRLEPCAPSRRSRATCLRPSNWPGDVPADRAFLGDPRIIKARKPHFALLHDDQAPEPVLARRQPRPEPGTSSRAQNYSTVMQLPSDPQVWLTRATICVAQ